MIYEHMRREIERAIHNAEHPVGMGPHTGMARISAATLRRLMAENAALEAAARQALEALEYGQHTLKQVSENQWESRGELAMQALRAALAQHSPATLIDPRGSLGEPIV